MSLRALILAAGRGERMRPLTDTTPKPLLEVHGKPLMQWPMEALAAGGFTEVAVNTAWLGDRIAGHFGDSHGETQITYSHEARDFGGALETAGGIMRLLPWLGDMFWVVAGDVFAPGFRFTQQVVDALAASDDLGRLWLVPNPEHNPKGDFGIDAAGRATNDAADSGGTTGSGRLTFSTIGLYRRALFEPPYCEVAPGNATGASKPLAPILRAAIGDARIGATLFTGEWTDVGTPERLEALKARWSC